jgi:hypothetical protein
MKTVVDLAAAEDQTTTGNMELAVAVAELHKLEKMHKIQLHQTELVLLDIQEDLVGGQELLLEELEQIIAGLHGLELAEAAELECTELQAEAAAAADLQAEVHAVAELEDK